MIVIARSYGQLGNRLILFGHFIAAAEEYGVTLANPCFSDYAHLFPATARDPWCRYPLQNDHPSRNQDVTDSSEFPSLRRRRWLAQGTYLAARALTVMGLGKRPVRVIRVKGEQAVDLGSPEFAELVSSRHVMAQGWLFRSERLIKKHADKVRAHFQIAKEHQEAIAGLLAGIRTQADIVIGVHIRHGDYATFMNGKYYYSVEQYTALMRGMAERMPGRRVAFLVCGNGQLNQRDFDGLNVTFGTGHLLEDLYGLAETDFIIGPPSTFTRWASFYGDVPLQFIESADDPIDIREIADRNGATSRVA